jgi:ssDNA-binding Zn-finger/Zn-ribbon topoisomerase 1
VKELEVGDVHFEERDPWEECATCGGLMVEKNGKHGSFRGCVNFPICRGTKSLYEEHFEAEYGFEDLDWGPDF